MMKQMKKLSTLATGSMVVGLLLGTSMAQAVDVCMEGDVVTEIKGLVVQGTNEFGDITIDVKFQHVTGFDIYGPDLLNMPFHGHDAEVDAALVIDDINDTLNGPMPLYAGESGEKDYFIGTVPETEGPIGAVGALGGENIAGVNWDPCVTQCLLGTSILAGDERHVYADLTKADGSDCGSAPPDSQSITPGFSGSWFDETREGEGFNIEIGGPTLDPYLLTYFYTYDKSGNQMWLTGFADINGDTAVVDMTVTSGTVFGDNFDPDDVNYDSWGTITFKFSSCNAGTAAYVSDDFGDGTFNLVHTTGIAGLSCP